MPRKATSNRPSTRSRKARGRRFRFTRYLPSKQQRKRWYRAIRRKPMPMQLLVLGAVLFVLWFGVNWLYQVVRKPSELFFPVSGVLSKTPPETWDEYESLFRSHSTATMTPALLAALAQIEGSGNPIVRTYWRWSFTRKPFDVYKPASSAVGMYQITDGTFEIARHYCIHDHHVVEDGPWNDPQSCWFNWLYTRTIPSNAVEMTSAYLDHQINGMLTRNRLTRATVEQRQVLVALTHLCGAGAGDDFARRGFRWLPGQKCGDHDARAYVNRVLAMRNQFERIAAQRAASD